MAELGIGAVLDLSQLQKMLEDFSEATGLATVAVDTRGIPVTAACAFTDFCRVIRSDPVRNKMCQGCDAHGGLQSLIDGAPHIYRCHSGLVDFSVPVTDGDKYVGAILCGQVRVPDTEQPEFLTLSTHWRGDEQLEQLYLQVPESNLRRVAAAAKTLLGLSESLEGVRLPKRLGPQHPLPAIPAGTDALPHIVPVHLVPPVAKPEKHATDKTSGDLRAALEAEDLAGAYSELSQLLDAVYLDAGDPREGISRLEGRVVEIAKDCAPRLVPHLTQMVLRYQDRRAASVNRYQMQLYFERLMCMVLDEIVRCRPHRHRDLRDLLNDIARHPNRALSLTEAAASTHWSPGHLSKLFKTVTGYTFVSYVTAWRVSRAELMLASTQMPVQKIAAELDFHQVNYFSRVFRAHTGVSPSEYRRQCSARDGRPAGVSLPAHHHALLRA
jgi:ligand-binding sensor protein/AraC-like DNA-binding protein